MNFNITQTYTEKTVFFSSTAAVWRTPCFLIFANRVFMMWLQNPWFFFLSYLRFSFGKLRTVWKRVIRMIFLLFFIQKLTLATGIWTWYWFRCHSSNSRATENAWECVKKKKKEEEGISKSVQLTDLKEWLCPNLIRYESTSRSSGDECDGSYWKMNSARLALSLQDKRSILPTRRQTTATWSLAAATWMLKKLTFIQIGRLGEPLIKSPPPNLKRTELPELSSRSPRLTCQLICSHGNLSQEKVIDRMNATHQSHH